jgi:hypothetical protein
MIRPRMAPLSICSPLICVGLLALAGTATADPIRIRYSVTGGAFDGPYSSGSITGGKIALLALTANPYTGFAPALVTALTLSGPAGFFKLEGPFSGATGSALFTPSFVGLFGHRSLPQIRSGGNAMVAASQDAMIEASVGYGVGMLSGRVGSTGPYFTHSFSIGNEVRTAPEPATGLVLGLGLGVLGLASPLLRRRGRRSGSVPPPGRT